MKIFINGDEISLDAVKLTISEALQHYLSPEQQKKSFAVALNSDFVGKDNYPQTPIHQGDSIDVLFPIQGG